MNKVILMGRLTKDVETRFTNATAKQVSSFTIAVNRRFAQGDTKADFIPVVAWNKTAEFCSKYFAKGQQVVVVGSMQNRSWDDKDGNKRYITEVIADEAYFADSKKDGVGQTGDGFKAVEDDDESLPF